MSRLTWYQIFLVKMHLVYSIWSSSSVSVASYSFINLLFIIIIFFCPWANSFSQFGSDQLLFFLIVLFFLLFLGDLGWVIFHYFLLSWLPYPAVFSIYLVSFWDDSLINVVLPACIACALLKIGIAWTILPWASPYMLHILLFKRGRSVLLVKTVTCIQIAEDGILSRAEDPQ